MSFKLKAKKKNDHYTAHNAQSITVCAYDVMYCKIVFCSIKLSKNSLIGTTPGLSPDNQRFVFQFFTMLQVKTLLSNCQ